MERKRIGADLWLEEVESGHVPDLATVYAENYIENDILRGGVAEQYIRTALAAKEFAFGLCARYRGKATGFVLFIHLREGVLAALELVYDKRYPFLLAASTKGINAEVASRCVELGIRKLEAIAETTNTAAIRNLNAIGFHKYYTIGGCDYFENYLPSIFSIEDFSDEGMRKSPYFDMKKDFFRLAGSYRRSFKSTDLQCSFEVSNRGVLHKFVIDRFAEGCTSFEREGDLRVSCTPSSRVVMPLEPTEMVFSIENYSSQSRSLEMSAQLDGAVPLFADRNSVIKAHGKMTFRTRAGVSDTGVHQVQSGFRVGDVVVNLRAGFCVTSPAQIDYLSNGFASFAKSAGELQLKLSNTFANPNVYDLRLSGSRSLAFRPSRKRLSVKPGTSRTATFAVRPKGEGLVAARLSASCGPADRPRTRSSTDINFRVTARKDACVANIIDDFVLMNSAGLKVTVNLRTGLLHMIPVSNNLLRVFHFWDEIGPPFSEFAWADWAADHTEPYADMRKNRPYAIAPLRETYRKQKIAAKITRNLDGEVSVELTAVADDHTISKEIILRSDSLVRFQSKLIGVRSTHLTAPTNVQHGHAVKCVDLTPQLLVKPCCCFSDGAILLLPLDGEESPRRFDRLRERYEMARLLENGSRLSENWVWYAYEKQNYTFGLFWEGEPEVDSFHLWYPKLPWLCFKGAETAPGTLTFPSYYFRAGEGDLQTAMQHVSRAKGDL